MKKSDCLAMGLGRYWIIKFLLLMKLSIIFLFLTAFQAIANTGNTQEQVSLHLKNTSLSAALKKIETDYSYRFVYSDSVALSQYRVNLDVKNASIDAVMNQLLGNTSFIYKKMSTNLMVIMDATKNKARYQVKGMVADSTGSPIAGASVLEKGTTNGAITNAEGNLLLLLQRCLLLLLFQEWAILQKK